MKHLMASVAIVAAFAAPVFASDEITAETTIGVTAKTFTDNHDWVGKPVFDSNMEKVGEVERVSFDAQGYVDEIVVETGGFLDLGGHEVEIAADQYSLVTAEGDEGDAEIQLAMTTEVFSAMPHFDEDRASDYPLSDNDLFDGIDEDKGEIDTDVVTMGTIQIK